MACGFNEVLILLFSKQISTNPTALNRQEFLGGFYAESGTFCVCAFGNISRKSVKRRTPKNACDIASHISLK
jgi:hypothetical protein